VALSALADLAELPAIRVWNGVSGRGGERVTMAVIELDPSRVVPEHIHEHEQIGVCVTGSVTFRVGDEEHQLGSGGSLRIHAGMPHEVHTGPDGAVVIETWAPRRDDWAALERREDGPLRWPR
jgi:quercetin dioxygenase-like cupin family protein